MPLPIIAIVSALAAGGTLVPHAAGGLIVTGAGGYVAGTFLSTAAISGILSTTAATLGVGALYFTGTAASIWGGAGVLGTTIGATGIKGLLMSFGIIASTPVWVPIATLTAIIFFGYASFRLFALRRKLHHTPEGQEAIFTEAEARIIEKIIQRLAKKKEFVWS